MESFAVWSHGMFIRFSPGDLSEFSAECLTGFPRASWLAGSPERRPGRGGPRPPGPGSSGGSSLRRGAPRPASGTKAGPLFPGEGLIRPLPTAKALLRGRGKPALEGEG